MVKPRVLLLDDESGLPDLAASSLSGGFSVLHARTPEQALAVLDVSPEIAVVLCRRHLAARDEGLFLQECRSRSKATRILVIENVDETVAAALRDGSIHAYLCHPIDAEHLRVGVQAAYRAHQAALPVPREKPKAADRWSKRTATVMALGNFAVGLLWFGGRLLLMPEHASLSAIAIGEFDFVLGSSAALWFVFDRKMRRRQKVEERLRHSYRILEEASSEFRAILDTAPDAILVFLADGRLEMANTAAVALFGLPESELLGRGAVELIPKLDPMISGFRPTEADGTGVIFSASFSEGEAMAGTGEAIHVELALSAWIAGQELRFTVVARDIGSKRKTEEALRRAQKIEALAHLTGGVAHDFNNTLAAITSNLELIEEMTANQPDVAGRIEAALRAAERGAGLTRRLLAFARQAPASTRSCDMAEELGKIEAVLRRTLPANIGISLSVEPDLWRAEIDPAEFENAVINLAVNSMHAMPGGGRLSIEAGNAVVEPRQARIDGIAAGDYVLVSVHDNGQGIPELHKDKLFVPFFTTKEQGTGLGLSVVFGFAKRSKGLVKIYSEEGVGTTVRLFLPRTREEGGLLAAPGAELVRGAGQRILVIEDDRDVLGATLETLESLGYQPLSVRDPVDGIALVEAGEPIDLVLSDVMLAGSMDGFAVARLLGESHPGLPVILMSGFAGGMALAPELEGWSDRLISKPFRRRELAQRLARALGI